MKLKDLVNSAKDFTEKTIKDAKDPEKKAERQLKRAETIVSLTQKGAAAYETLSEATDKAVNTAKKETAETLKKIEPLAKKFDTKAGKALKTGKDYLDSVSKKIKKYNSGSNGPQ